MTGLKDKHIYEWTECKVCHKPLPKGFPRDICNECGEKIFGKPEVLKEGEKE